MFDIIIWKVINYHYFLYVRYLIKEVFLTKKQMINIKHRIRRYYSFTFRICQQICL